jgi:hypothetical protein
MTKIVRVSFDVALADSATEEQVAGVIGEALASQKTQATALGKLKISTPIRDNPTIEKGEGWDKVIWEKSTC